MPAIEGVRRNVGNPKALAGVEYRFLADRADPKVFGEVFEFGGHAGGLLPYAVRKHIGQDYTIFTTTMAMEFVLPPLLEGFVDIHVRITHGGHLDIDRIRRMGNAKLGPLDITIQHLPYFVKQDRQQRPAFG